MVVKRTGRVEQLYRDKIYEAIIKTLNDLSDNPDNQSLANKAADTIYSNMKDACDDMDVSIQTIERETYLQLYNMGLKEAAESYKNYTERRAKEIEANFKKKK